MRKKEGKRSRRTLKVFLLTYLGFLAAPLSSKAIGLLVGAALSIAGITLSMLLEYFHKNIYKGLRMMEAWGIYYANVLAQTIHGGLLYYLAMFMFLWGLWKHLFPHPAEMGVTIAARSGTDYVVRFVTWMAYFGIMLYIIGLPWSSRYNLVRLSVGLADATTNSLVEVLNGYAKGKAENLITAQLMTINVEHAINEDMLPVELKKKIADFVKRCGSYGNDFDRYMGVYSLAMLSTDPDFQDYTYSASASGTVSCSELKKQLRSAIAAEVKARFKKISEQTGIPYNVLLANAEKKGENFYEHNLKGMARQIFGASAEADKYTSGTPSNDELLAMYALNHSDVATSVYENLSYAMRYGSYHPSGLGKFTGGLMRALGTLFILIASFITKTLLPFFIDGLYIANSVIFAILLVFFPLILVLALSEVSDVVSVIKYIFILIWVKAWLVPTSMITNLYINYLDKNVTLLPALVVASLLLMVPSLMAIVLLQGNAAISKLGVGVESAVSSGSRVFTSVLGQGGVVISSAGRAAERVGSMEGMTSTTAGPTITFKGTSGEGFASGGGGGASGGPSHPSLPPPEAA